MNFLTGKPESPAHRELKPLLFDEGCQVLSTFDLNKVASLTYGDLVCDEIFELVENIVAKPLEHTPLTLQKTLVVMKHVLIYGSEKCVNSGYGIGKFVETLQNFNTILATQQQQGALAFLQRLQGGGVDRGGPVREAATDVHKLLSNINELQRIRNESASQNSLVPIGDDKVAFLTDEVRHHILKKRIEQQQQIEIKSNLAKSEGGFGGGYNAKDGKHVVGAAHGIEEMLKIAKRDKKKFSDTGDGAPTEEDRILNELEAEARQQKALAAQEAATRNEDLLSTANPASRTPPANVNLLDFGPTPTQAAPVPANATGDLLGGFGTSSVEPTQNNDLLGLSGGMTQGGLLDMTSPPGMSSTLGGGLATPGLLDPVATNTTAQSIDPFAAVAPTAAPPLPSSGMPPSISSTSPAAGLAGLTGGIGAMSVGETTAPKPIMASQGDRFAALDALASGSSGTKVTALDAKLAENRLMAGTSSSSGVGGLSMMTSTGMNQKASAALTTPEPTSQPPPTPLDMPMGMPHAPPPEQQVIPGSGQVATSYGDVGEDDQDNPWIMGGHSGDGLEPVGPAPGAPPPPPPPSS